MTVDTLTNGQTLTTALSGQTLKVMMLAAVVRLKVQSVFVRPSEGEGGEARGEIQWQKGLRGGIDGGSEGLWG